jgi:hypothetical protein
MPKAYVLYDQENDWVGFLYDKDCHSAVVKFHFRPGTETTKQT